MVGSILDQRTDRDDSGKRYDGAVVEFVEGHRQPFVRLSATLETVRHMMTTVIIRATHLVSNCTSSPIGWSARTDSNRQLAGFKPAVSAFPPRADDAFRSYHRPCLPWPAP